MHDLESFFWGLFWNSVHFSGPDKSRVLPEFDKWNYADTQELARSKKGIVDDEGDFLAIAEESFTSYFQPLIPWMNKLRKVVFPGDRRWRTENKGLFSQMIQILQGARDDIEVSSRG